MLKTFDTMRQRLRSPALLRGLGWMLCGLAAGLPAHRADARPRRASAPLPLKIAGAQIMNSKNQPVTLRGVNAASMEWSNNGEGHILNTVNAAIRDWNANLIRLPLSQDRWFGKAPDQNGDFKPYRALVKQVVDACSAQNCYIILDLHWSDGNKWGQEIGQHVHARSEQRYLLERLRRRLQEQPRRPLRPV